MFTSMGVAVLVGVVAWGGYLYYRVSQLDRKLSEYAGALIEGDNDD